MTAVAAFGNVANLGALTEPFMFCMNAFNMLLHSAGEAPQAWPMAVIATSLVALIWAICVAVATFPASTVLTTSLSASAAWIDRTCKRPEAIRRVPSHYNRIL